MADITASDVKALRDRTGAGMMDCKRALTETGVLVAGPRAGSVVRTDTRSRTDGRHCGSAMVGGPARDRVGAVCGGPRSATAGPSWSVTGSEGRVGRSRSFHRPGIRIREDRGASLAAHTPVLTTTIPSSERSNM